MSHEKVCRDLGRQIEVDWEPEFEIVMLTYRERNKETSATPSLVYSDVSISIPPLSLSTDFKTSERMVNREGLTE
jgi:hypothetical protein